MSTAGARGTCRHCGRSRELGRAGQIIAHAYRAQARCPGAGHPPADVTPGEGQWELRARAAESTLAAIEALPVRSGGVVLIADLQAALDVAS